MFLSAATEVCCTTTRQHQRRVLGLVTCFTEYPRLSHLLVVRGHHRDDRAVDLPHGKVLCRELGLISDFAKLSVMTRQDKRNANRIPRDVKCYL